MCPFHYVSCGAVVTSVGITRLRTMTVSFLGEPTYPLITLLPTLRQNRPKYNHPTTLELNFVRHKVCIDWEILGWEIDSKKFIITTWTLEDSFKAWIRVFYYSLNPRFIETPKDLWSEQWECIHPFVDWPFFGLNRVSLCAHVLHILISCSCWLLVRDPDLVV
jgi:hypothetical protein